MSRKNNHSKRRYVISDFMIILVVLAVLLVTNILDGPAAVRIPVGVITVLVLPGYAITAALFPRKLQQPDESSLRVQSQQGGITFIERAALSVGVSLAVVALAGIGLDWLFGQITAPILLDGVLGIIVVSVGTGVFCRRQVPDGQQYAPSVSLSRARRLTRLDGLSVLLAVSVLFAGGAVAFAAMGTENSEALTELYFVADADDEEYPTTFAPGTAQEVSLEVGNLEGKTMTYSVVGELQQVERQNQTVLVTDRMEIYREQLTVGDGETVRIDTSVEPNTAAGTYRLIYLLYRGDAPSNPQITTAYREVHLWVEVTEPTGGGL